MKCKYLRPEDIRKLNTFEFAPRQVVEGYLAGRHRSHTIGSSTEFRDYRPYSAGDDLRKVDWRVYARTDRHYLRTHNQETNTGCHIFLDSSASMGFGERITKLEYASFFAAALCYLVTRRGDAASLMIFDQKVRHFFPPGSTTRHLNHLLHALERNEAGAETSLSHALQKTFPLLHGRGTLVLLSDFLDDAAAIFTALNPYLHRGFEIYLFQILDPAEIELPDRGLLSLRDMETRERITAHTHFIRHAYNATMQQHIRALREWARRRQQEYMLARTDAHFFHLFDRLVQ